MIKTIFITGVTAGIGAAAARKFVSRAGRSSAPAAAATGSMRWRRNSAISSIRLMLDMRCPDDFGPALEALPERYRAD